MALIPPLERYSPNDELPGTYEEYLESHPLVPAEFSEPVEYEPLFKSEGSLSILIDADLYPQITTRLNQYTNDLRSEGYTVFSENISGGTPQEIKVWVNGNNVKKFDMYDGWHFLAPVPVSLDAGWNRLLFKISQEGGKYLFSAMLTDPLFRLPCDLECQINNPDTHGQGAKLVGGWIINGFHQDIESDSSNYLTTNYLGPGVDEASINPSFGEVMGGKTWTLFDIRWPYVGLSDY